MDCFAALAMTGWWSAHGPEDSKVFWFLRPDDGAAKPRSLNRAANKGPDDGAAKPRSLNRAANKGPDDGAAKPRSLNRAANKGPDDGAAKPRSLNRPANKGSKKNRLLACCSAGCIG
jgi:hypothetical protein